MKIFLTDFAKTQIKTIYSYHKAVASIDVAKKIKSEIDIAILKLKDFPEAGQIEEYMAQFGKPYRRLVTSHYKIIYRIDGDIVFITDVFDSRQSPLKIKS